MPNITEQLIKILLSIFLIVFGNDKTTVTEKIVKQKEKELMTIQIDKIELFNKIYDKKSKQNDIDKNVIILDESDYPDKENGTVLIGAHSGTGNLAYFKRLDELELNDEIKLFFDNKEYVYHINNISKDTKDGRIRVDYSIKESRLILYTCNPNDKGTYLVISALR